MELEVDPALRPADGGGGAMEDWVGGMVGGLVGGLAGQLIVSSASNSPASEGMLKEIEMDWSGDPYSDFVDDISKMGKVVGPTDKYWTEPLTAEQARRLNWELFKENIIHFGANWALGKTTTLLGKVGDVLEALRVDTFIIPGFDEYGENAFGFSPIPGIPMYKEGDIAIVYQVTIDRGSVIGRIRSYQAMYVIPREGVFRAQYVHKGIPAFDPLTSKVPFHWAETGGKIF